MIKKNIVYIFPALVPTGPTNQTYYLIRGLVESGFKVTLFVLSSKRSSETQIKRFENIGVKIYFFRFNLFDLIAARKLVREISPNLVHSTLLTADLAAILIACGYKRFITHRTDPFDHIGSRGPFIGRLMFYLSKYISSKTYKSIACSHAIHNRLKNRGIKSDLVIQNCVNNDFYMGINKSESFFHNIEIVDSEIVILVIGTLCERKNPLFTYRVVSNAVIRYGLKIRLIYLGDGRLMEELSKLSVPQNLILELVGSVSDVRPFIAKSDLHMSSSIAEGLPNSVLETLSCGLPNFLSNIPEHLEFQTSAPDLLSFFSLSDSLDEISMGLVNFMHHLNACSSSNSVQKIRNDFSEKKLVCTYIRSYDL